MAFSNNNRRIIFSYIILVGNFRAFQVSVLVFCRVISFSIKCNCGLFKVIRKMFQFLISCWLLFLLDCNRYSWVCDCELELLWIGWCQLYSFTLRFVVLCNWYFYLHFKRVGTCETCNKVASVWSFDNITPKALSSFFKSIPKRAT